MKNVFKKWSWKERKPEMFAFIVFGYPFMVWKSIFFAVFNLFLEAIFQMWTKKSEEDSEKRMGNIGNIIK